MREIFYCILFGLGMGIFGAGIKDDSTWMVMIGIGVAITGIDLIIDTKIKNSKGD